MENYEIVRKIGAGNFAKVYLAVHTPTGKKVALKVIDKDGAPSARKLVHKVRREIRNMRRLRHRNIVQIYESFESRSRFVIAMEYLPNGELFDYVWRRRGLEENEARELFSRVAEGVHHCHLNSVVHRDLKLENILLDSAHQPKLADFGFSKEVHCDQFLETYCGSSLYASPEMILGRPYSGTECDVWSLGVILYTMLTATMPFDDRNVPVFLKCIERGMYPEPSTVSQLGKDLISRILDPNAATRASMEEILAHPWLSQPPSKTPSAAAARRTDRTTADRETADLTDADASSSSLNWRGGSRRTRVEHFKILRKNSSGCSGYSSDSSGVPFPEQPPSGTPCGAPPPPPPSSNATSEHTKLFSRFHATWKMFSS